MTLIKLAGFFVLTTLSFHSIEGKNILLLNGDKDNTDLKSPEKRASNFRMNEETPFDPNFWPARGRRGRRDPEKLDDCIAADDYFEFQCQQETKAKRSDSNTAIDLDSGISPDRERMGGDCYGSLVELKMEGIKKKFASDGMEAKISHRLNQLMSNKRRRQKILPLSRFLAYGNGLYYEPGNSLGEKMKKQDVFWVVRGKKNSQVKLFT